jgi:hypothetical protein
MIATNSTTRFAASSPRALATNTGQLRQAKALSINKIGHAMHDLDPVCERFTRGPKLAEVARDLGFRKSLRRERGA